MPLKQSKKHINAIFHKLKFKIVLEDLLHQLLHKKLIQKEEIKKAIVGTLIELAEKESKLSVKHLNEQKQKEVLLSEKTVEEKFTEHLNDYLKNLKETVNTLKEQVHHTVKIAHDCVDKEYASVSAETKIKMHDVIDESYRFDRLMNTVSQLQAKKAVSIENTHCCMHKHIHAAQDQLTAHLKVKPEKHQEHQHEHKKMEHWINLATVIHFGHALCEKKIEKNEESLFVSLFSTLKEKVNPQVANDFFSAVHQVVQQAATPITRLLADSPCALLQSMDAKTETNRDALSSETSESDHRLNLKS